MISIDQRCSYSPDQIKFDIPGSIFSSTTFASANIRNGVSGMGIRLNKTKIVCKPGEQSLEISNGGIIEVTCMIGLKFHSNMTMRLFQDSDR